MSVSLVKEFDSFAFVARRSIRITNSGAMMPRVELRGAAIRDALGAELSKEMVSNARRNGLTSPLVRSFSR